MDKNFSYTYLLPLLSEQVNLKKSILTFITNTYIKTNRNNNLGKFYIKCKFNYSDTDFSKLENILISNDLYETSYDIKNEILYEFNFPKEYISEQEKFIKGKYSEFKDDTKKLILRFWSELFGHIPSFVTNILIKIKQILYKDERLRLLMNKNLKINIEKGSELGDKIEMRDETFIFENEEKKINLNDIKTIF